MPIEFIHKDKPKTWQEGELTATRSAIHSAPGCHDGCGVVFYTDKEGKVVKVEGDIYAPFNQGRLCMRCLDYREAANHPDRLKWPLKRVGERGENKWERISWDEAYDIIEERVKKIWAEHGPETIVGMEGTGRNICWQLPYLVYAGFGSPNFTLGFLSGDSCYLPRAAQQAVMAGDFTVVDCSQMFDKRYDTSTGWQLPEFVVIWGNNPIVANADGFFGHWIVDLMRRGTKIAVVDPSLLWLASRAEMWLRIRPGTDTALAMAMIKIIIDEDLYDHDFVENWTVGFDRLAERAKEYDVDKVSQITWIPKEKIIALARRYATAKPAAIQWGLAVDMKVDGISCAQAINALWAITGNTDVPGGNIIARFAYNVDHTYNTGLNLLDPEIQKKRFGFDASPLKRYGFASTAHGDSVLKAIESGKPYPVKMLWFQSTNPIANMASEAPRVYDAIKKVDFVVVVDPVMTPTAVAAADIVLPAAMSGERNSSRAWFYPFRCLTKVSQYEEVKSDEQIVIEVGKRLKPENFPWQDDKGFLEWTWKNEEAQKWQWGEHFDDVSFDEFSEAVYSFPKFEYKKYEKGLLRADGEPGFNTPSGKIELAIGLFDYLEMDALPEYVEPPESPYSTPELYKEYPFVLTTGQRSYEFFHSEHHNLPTMREFHPDPTFEIHPDAAKNLGLKEGDWCWLENQRGRCRMKLTYNVSLDPRVLRAEHGWTFPEKNGAEPVLFGVFDSNINNLTTQCVNGPTGYGAPYKGLLCKVYQCTEENSQILPTYQVTRLGGFGYVK